jgi:cysteinyl-tRNA synthetase
MRIFNTLSGQKEEFIPRGDTVKMYVCGVTPYDECHIGHAMSYVIFDVVRRYLEFRGYRVKYVQNFTDIDDKIIDRAHELGISTRELTDELISNYFAEMDALNIKRANAYPRATEEIPKIIEMVEGLINREHAYESGGSVYFRVRSDPNYGKLSRRNLEDMVGIAGPGIEGDKEHPLDFALWKTAKEGEPSWESPWGLGRPGWHIECSAMCLKYLGDTLDIHGGGQDLVFPHHENEIAQSECFTGVTPFVRYWLHNGLVQLGGEKMSKSLSNLITVKEALEKFSPDAIRLFILSSHYRSPLTYTEDAVEAMERGLERLRRAVREEDEPNGAGILNPEPYRQRFIEAMDDDFNTARALAALFDLARDVNSAREEGSSTKESREVLMELAGVLGLTLEEKEREPLPAEPFIELLVSIRNELRAAKQWQLADRIRSALAERDVALEDTPEGSMWKHKSNR